MTFGICLFIILMQFLWRYIDDLVGKGLGILIVAEMMFYAALSLVPTALPLAILLASLMTFGNLGEQIELLAMKAAGVSLIRIMRPLIILVCFISAGAFFFQNNVTPVAQVKLYTLLFSMRQTSPELDIPEGVFYKEINGYNVYVKQKDKKTGILRNVMIYDHSRGFGNIRVILADSGKLKTSADKMFLVLTLFSGESFQNMEKQKKINANENVRYSRETFTTKDILIEFDANFNRIDDSYMQNQYIGKNLKELQASIDTMSTRLDSIRDINAKAVRSTSYLKIIPQPHPSDTIGEKQAIKRDSAIIRDFQNLFKAKSPSNQAGLLASAITNVEGLKTTYYFNAATLSDDMYKMRRHLIELHKKFSLSFACLVFFFIGAPLGAIVRKGGFGMPIVISVVLFIFYYIIDNIGFKMARDGVWQTWEGIWLSSGILTPLGIFLTYKAVNDSVILNADTYINAVKNLFGKRSGRNIQKKEVIIYSPDYNNIAGQLTYLNDVCSRYLEQNKPWISYFKFWKQGQKDNVVSLINGTLENIIEEMGNSDQNLILNKLMDYPILGGYNKQNSPFNGFFSILIGLLFPIGIPIYLISVYQRKLLIHDIKTILKINEELKQLITENLEPETI